MLSDDVAPKFEYRSHCIDPGADFSASTLMSALDAHTVLSINKLEGARVLLIVQARKVVAAGLCAQVVFQCRCRPAERHQGEPGGGGGGASLMWPWRAANPW